MRLGACGQGTPAEDVELKAATKDTQQALEGASTARKVLEIFGVLPNYSCGPISGAIGNALPPVSVPFACAKLATREGGMDFTFAEGGCEVGGRIVKGSLGFELGIGEDRIDVTADFRKLSVDGQVLPVRVGAGVCGDEKRIWATVEDVVVADSTFNLDARLGYRKGLPIFGHSDLTLDGTGSLEQPKPIGTTSVGAEGLEYEIGATLPKAGRLTVNRTDGTHFSVKFTEVLWKVGKAEITIGERAPVELPIVN